jgi:dTDP-L-rhamnose 4-epimerase
MRILVTGGAGFIGSHTVDALLSKGHEVRVYDNLDPQVHGARASGFKLPDYFDARAEFIYGDVRDKESVKAAMEGVDGIFHLAAAVGVGQSMYEVQKYVEANTLGAAVLLDLLVNHKHQVQKVVVASSMSIYGEGQYLCEQHGDVFPTLRSDGQLEARDWEMRCPHCSETVKPVPTSEAKPLFPTSIYAITKRDHEEMFLTIGRAYKIPTTALRYFNAYGTRQALSNPYTGVAAIFSSRFLNHKEPIVFEDGRQSRDFIHVSDIVQSNMLAFEREGANYEVFNVGSGAQTSILDVAELLGKLLAPDIKPQVVGQFRQGDIRHCFADISKIKDRLGFLPKVDFKDGIGELVDWVRDQEAEDLVESARAELIEKSLVR